MSSRQYPNASAYVHAFSKSPSLSMVAASPSLYSQESLPRDSWNTLGNSNMFSHHETIEGNLSINDHYSKQILRTSSNEPLRSDQYSTRPGVGHHQVQVRRGSFEEGLVAGNSAISQPMRLRVSGRPRAPSATESRRSPAGARRRPEASNSRKQETAYVTLPVAHSNCSLTSITAQRGDSHVTSAYSTRSTIGSLIGYYMHEPMEPIPHMPQLPHGVASGTPEFAHPRSEPPVATRKHSADTTPPSASSTSTCVDSQFTIVRTPPPPPGNFFPETPQNERTVRYHPVDIVISGAPGVFESEIVEDEVPRWRRWERRRPVVTDPVMRRGRPSSLTSHRRRLGVPGVGDLEPTSCATPFHYSTVAASVMSLPARIQSAVSLPMLGEKRKSFKYLYRFKSIFSQSSANSKSTSFPSAHTSASTETNTRSSSTGPGRAHRTRTLSAFSISKFSLFSKRKRSSEDIRQYIRVGHPNTIEKSDGTLRGVSISSPRPLGRF